MPERVLISLEDVVLSFGGQPLFAELTMHIAEGDKICLVGKNGAGKTTLMRLITGELELDGGKRFMLPGVSVGYLAQQVPFDPGHHVREFVLSGLDPDDMDYREHLADMVIGPLTLDPDALMGTLSGGQLRRAALARALVAEPDVLMLDEPTNHLDLTAIEWLEQYLNSYRGALLCVSHDRTFLAAISRKVFWIDRGGIRVCPKGYAEFDAWADVVIEQEARELQNMTKKLAAEVDWTQGGVSGRRKRNQRRLRELYNLREKLRVEKAAHKGRHKSIDAEAESGSPASRRVVEFRHVGKSFGKLTILNDFNLLIRKGDRIGILGKNGSGKSTFLKLLVGEMEPDEGRINRAKNIEIAYFDQNRSELNPSKTLRDTLCPGGGDYVFLGSSADPRPIHVCGYLKNFLFDPRLVRDRVGTLSGGQQNRLMLAKMLANPGNVLILDEPTNDLDMDTLDMLQEILADYDGTLIIVSHDRDFLDRTVTEVMAFEGEGLVESHIGGYSDYIAAKKGIAVQAAKPAAAAPKPAAKEKKAPAKMSFKLVHELETLPARIAKLQKEIESLHASLEDANLYTKDPTAFDASARRLSSAQKELDAAETRWLELDALREGEV